MRYSLSVLSAIFFLSLSLLAGCGGGGGGGKSGGTPPSPVVYVGTTAFNPATSRKLSDHVTGFTTPVTWTFKAGSPGGSSTALNGDQSFTLSSVTISGTVLPCYRVFHADGSDPAYDQYEWWATATDGGLYRITVGAEDWRPGTAPATAPNSDPANPVLLAQPKLILPGTVTVGTSWTVGASPAMNLDQSEYGHRSTRTVTSANATSPHGFPGCVKVKVESADTDIVWYEYWMDGAGLVEVESIFSTPTPFTDYSFRGDLSTSG